MFPLKVSSIGPAILALAVCLFCEFSNSSGPARAQGAADPRDYRRVTRVPRQQVDRWIKDEVRKSGGDFDHQRYQFIIGFSTGHFGSDPVHAIAMRRLAFSLLNNTFASGDRVRPVAWEMAVWKVGDEVPLTPDASTRAAFVDAVPYAPSEASKGGHDAERALYDTLSRAVPKENAASTIVLLITNSNQSQGPTGERAALFGANNRQLAAAIRERSLRAPVRHSFTAFADNRPLTIDITALFPERIEAVPGAPQTSRYPTFPVNSWQPPADQPANAAELPNAVVTITELTPKQSTANALPPTKKSDPPWLLFALLVLAVLAGLVWLMNRRRPQPEKQAAPPAKGKPLPGAILAVVGTAPRSARTTLAPLTTASRWILVVEGVVPAILDAEAEVPAGVVKLAEFDLDERRRLSVKPEADVVLRDQVGHQTEGSTDRLLLLSPGGHVICRVTSTAVAREPVRLELTYQEKS